MDEVSKYYELCHLFDDNIECLVDFILHIANIKKGKKKMIDNFESLRLKNVSEELELIYSCDVRVIKDYVKRWRVFNGS